MRASPLSSGPRPRPCEQGIAASGRADEVGDHHAVAARCRQGNVREGQKGVRGVGNGVRVIEVPLIEKRTRTRGDRAQYDITAFHNGLVRRRSHNGSGGHNKFERQNSVVGVECKKFISAKVHRTSPVVVGVRWSGGKRLAGTLLLRRRRIRNIIEGELMRRRVDDGRQLAG